MYYIKIKHLLLLVMLNGMLRSDAIAPQRGDVVSFELPENQMANSSSTASQQITNLFTSSWVITYDFNTYHVLYYTEVKRPEILPITSGLITFPTIYRYEALVLRALGHDLCLKHREIHSINQSSNPYAFIVINSVYDTKLCLKLRKSAETLVYTDINQLASGNYLLAV